MQTFAENLSVIPQLEELTSLQLQDSQGITQVLIENKPGTQGSFRVYHYVANKWGGLGPEAAREALEIFAEHTADARLHPNKHPNIDRLFEIVEKGLRYTVKAN